MIRLFFARVMPLAWALQLVTGLAIGQSLKWSPDGNSYFVNERSRIVRYDLPGLKPEVVVSPELLIPDKQTMPISVEDFQFTSDGMKLLFFTNSKRVWRYRTRGDYWVLDTRTRKIRKLGEGRPESSLMFAKFSPDGKKAAYVSERNLYVEDLESGQIKQLTSGNGTPKLIHGTFDWVYEEEFAIRDGFRWSPDGKSIAYWQIDANAIRDFYMMNSTDSVYSRIVPVEYPKAGDPPSPARIGVADIASGQTRWMAIEGDPQEHYLPRMEWAPGGKSLVVQQFNRKQNHSRIID